MWIGALRLAVVLALGAVFDLTGGAGASRIALAQTSPATSSRPSGQLTAQSPADAGTLPSTDKGEAVAEARRSIGAVAAGGKLPPEQGLFGFLLPYTPSLFDLGVVAARNVAVVTYGSRRYDPVTRALVVSGLDIRRDAFHLAIGQARISADQVVLAGVALDTGDLPLDPLVREVLKKLDRQTVIGDIVMAFDANAPTADYAVTASIAFDGAGTLDLSADLLGFHILAPLDAADRTLGIQEDLQPESSGPQVVGKLRAASLSFRDSGLIAALYDVVGRSQGMSSDQARGTAAMMAGIGVASLTGALAGPPNPDLRTKTADWSATVQSFLRDPGRLTVTLSPPQPFDLSVLNTRGLTSDDVLVLGPRVVSGPDQRIALVDPARIAAAPGGPITETLPAAKAFIDGVGVPQDLARGVALALVPAAKGNRVAIALLSRAVALDPGVAIPQDQLRSAYVALLLAGADGLLAEGGSADALRDRLSPEEIAVAEDEALTRWRETAAGQAQHTAELAAFESRDWAAIRSFAYAYYEGTTMPRNAMRAYGWTSIAAAGGDRIAASLRDDLTRAVAAGRIVLPLDRARQATDDLWTLIVKKNTALDPAAAMTGQDTGAQEGGGTSPAAPRTGEALPPASRGIQGLQGDTAGPIDRESGQKPGPSQGQGAGDGSRGIGGDFEPRPQAKPSPGSRALTTDPAKLDGAPPATGEFPAK